MIYFRSRISLGSVVGLVVQSIDASCWGGGKGIVTRRDNVIHLESDASKHVLWAELGASVRLSLTQIFVLSGLVQSFVFSIRENYEQKKSACCSSPGWMGFKS